MKSSVISWGNAPAPMKWATTAGVVAELTTVTAKQAGRNNRVNYCVKHPVNYPVNISVITNRKEEII